MPMSRGTWFERLMRWRLLLVVNLLMIILLGLSLSREIIRSRAIGEEIAELQAKADALSAENFDLSGIRTAMQTESYIEREARLKLGLKKPGETVVVIQELEPGSAGTSPSDQTDVSDPLDLVIDDGALKEPVANPTKWWYYFFDKTTFNSLSKYE